MSDPVPPPAGRCPYLGLEGSRNEILPRPCGEHRCFVSVDEGELIPRRHQAQFCLRPQWEGCYKVPPAIIEPREVAPVPLVDPAPRPGESSIATRRLLAYQARVRAERSRSAAADTVPIALPERAAQGALWFWGALALPAVLLVGLATALFVAAFSPETRAARAAIEEAAADPELDSLSLVDLVQPTPIATFVPVVEDVASPYIAPALPEDRATGDADSGTASSPIDWPAQPALASPDRIWSSAVELDTAVIPVGSYIEEIDDQPIRFYEVAEFAAGWHTNSSLPGYLGNVVLAGHNNSKGSVFRDVGSLELGDPVFIDAGNHTYPYRVVIKEIVPETIVSDEQRALNGRWITQTDDERLTLVTCWPPESNTHRVIVVAVPDR